MNTTESRQVLWRCAATLSMAMAMALAVVGKCLASDARLKIVDYDPTKVIQLTARVGYHVHFEFAEDERFVNLGAGDTSAIDIGVEANHLLLKPKLPSSGTNLTILTNKRVYFIDFRATARSMRGEDPVYSIVFHYPATTPSAAHTALDSPQGTSRLDATRELRNRNYWFCGSPSLRPVEAGDDGLQLRLTFKPSTPLPAIYALTSDGAESLVNTHVEHDVVYVHQLYDRLILRRGAEVACVLDRSDHSSRRRTSHGTVDDATERATRKEVP